jgi:hypothetical protein
MPPASGLSARNPLNPADPNGLVLHPVSARVDDANRGIILQHASGNKKLNSCSAFAIKKKKKKNQSQSFL